VKTFHCSHCQQLVFFENVRCLHCAAPLAYLPEASEMGALEPEADGTWIAATLPEGLRRWRLCANYGMHDVCNWAVLASDPQALCRSCRLTRIIPNLDSPGHRTAWYRLEAAKRRLLYTILGLGLPLDAATSGEGRLQFEFLDDSVRTYGDRQRVLTGHDNGIITIAVAEADDVERERRRHELNEPYRTLVGHFRHEIGHYYWDRLIASGQELLEFRRLFGDERADYAEALERHYRAGPPSDWATRFVSAYASTHPWEDWAETWAHYLHMIDALETASVAGLSLQPARRDEPTLDEAADPLRRTDPDFGALLASWYPLTYVLNNLNRGLGLPDSYPFVLSAPAIDKLRFVHSIVVRMGPRRAGSTPDPARA